MSGLDRTFLSGLDRAYLFDLSVADDEIELVNVGFALSPLLDHKQAGVLQGLNMTAHSAFVQSHVFSKLGLPRKGEIVLPSVGEEHRERHLVPRAKGLHFQKKIGDLGEALLGRRVGSLKNDVALFEDIADVPVG